MYHVSSQQETPLPLALVAFGSPLVPCSPQPGCPHTITDDWANLDLVPCRQTSHQVWMGDGDFQTSVRT